MGPAWVGDIVMAHTAVGVLQARRPGTPVDLLVPAWAMPLANRMPGLRRVIPLHIRHGELHLGRRVRLARVLQRERYGQAIVLKRTFKSALIPALARIPRRTGVLGEVRYGLINDVRDVSEEQVPLNHLRYALLATEPGEHLAEADLPAPRLRVDPENRAAALRRLGLSGERAPVGLAPGAAYGPAKQWPREHWRRLAEALARRGQDVWIFGSDDEAEVARHIQGDGPPAIVDLTGRTSLADVVDLASLCRTVVSNDSGLMHVAAAAGAHVVALFGSTSPLNTPPLTSDRAILWHRLSCSPCYARTCPLGHLDCLRRMEPNEVLDACPPGPAQMPGPGPQFRENEP